MNRFEIPAIVATLLLSVAASASPVVQLSFSPTQTLPGVPVAMRVTMTNDTSSTIEINSLASVTMSGGGESMTRSINLDREIWNGEMGTPPTEIVPAGQTFDRVEPIDERLSLNPIFMNEDLPAWRPGEYDVTVTLRTSTGETFRSNAAHLSIVLPGSEDVAVWNELSKNGAFVSMSLLSDFAAIARHPASEYYRLVAPFKAIPYDRDLDHMATSYALATQSLPGAFLDGARLSIAMRYLDASGAASGQNRQDLAGALSAKGRVYTQQLVDSPASPFGPRWGISLGKMLYTMQQWQRRWNASQNIPIDAHVVPLVDCQSENPDGTFRTKFGYESSEDFYVRIGPGTKNRLSSGVDVGQPTEFAPGLHHNVFEVPAGPAGLTWWLMGSAGNPQLVGPRPCVDEISIDDPIRKAPAPKQ